MALIGAITLFIAGLFAGLIINIIATRLAHRRPLLGPVHCSRSRHPLQWWQIVPLYGFARQRGVCAECGRRLSLSYPLIEAAAGVLFAALFLFDGWSVALPLHAAYVAFLLLVLVIDWKHRDIYISVIALGSVLALAGSLLLPGVGIRSALIGAGIAGGFFLTAYLLARLIFPKIEEPLGAGDVLLALMMGLMLGFPNVVGALLIGPLLAGASALLLLVSRRSKLGDFMPYGVALCAATILLLVYPGPFVAAFKLPTLASVVFSLFGGS